MYVHYYNANMEPHAIFAKTVDYDEVLGDVDSNYVVLLFQKNTAHERYCKYLFTNDLDECDSEMRKWLDPHKHEFYTEWHLKQHYFGVVLDLKNNKEIAYGDAWQLDEDKVEWSSTHAYTGIHIDE